MSTSAKTEELRRLAALGYTSKEAMDATGLSRSGVNMAARRHGFRFASVNDHAVARMRACADQGMTSTQAERHLGLCKGHAAKMARIHGIVFAASLCSPKVWGLKPREQRRAEAAERRHARASTRSAAAAAKVQAERERAQAEEAARHDPVNIVVALIQRDGCLPREVAMRLRPETLAAAMAQLARGRDAGART